MLTTHRKHAAKHISCAVITVSDTRTKETDKSGKKIIDLLTNHEHQVNFYEIISDDEDHIRKTVETTVFSGEIEAVIVNGGTGISHRDVTIESIEPLFEKQLPGFGELFRHLSFQYDIGTASILSRAICGVRNHCVIFSIPGSTGAVTLAMEKIILPEVGHMVREIHKDLEQR
ncbi:MogA/MoaB family molybdenum cofactor biosynthesis protein [Oceanobacillus oncorhynchi]|uniref:Molybdenum cofactor biosynthesis protein B n=1 Tax=Oceanobacillus oncorhynchi TaxID=545501 RepID=A0A0A1MD27_9BACI|nr:MogA/MoaB family molybdenum cofactor biosynthesis protein [Oceanobacillus oncorhynchi]UUI39386.1 MogA/MoaB family molybdenum cofactor biosynthesis protein [Oceanobacillus oncorhynchi]CEI80983.1 Molybdenum cofactor biosynthesis protein B [Oceanobacillus oncorhynchi]